MRSGTALRRMIALLIAAFVSLPAVGAGTAGAAARLRRSAADNGFWNLSAAGAQSAGGGGGISVQGNGFDYRSIANQLSKVKYSDNEIVREIDKYRIKVPKDDLCAGEPDTECPVDLYAEVVRPKPVKPYPTILELSPYHGTIADRSGTRALSGPKQDPLPPYIANDKDLGAGDIAIGTAGYFAPRGYAVVFVNLRGTGKSNGCLDHLGLKDQSDANAVINWIKKQPWSNGRIGMMGHSYVAASQMLAAAQHNPALKTIVPSAGLAAMYHHKFQYGVPYFLQWVGPAEAYEELAINRHLPGLLGSAYGDNFGNGMQFFGCGMQNSAVISEEDFESGKYDNDEPFPWDLVRDYRKEARKADLRVFSVHGVNDNAARIAALDWFHSRRGKPGDKVWLGQWDHGSGVAANNRTCDVDDQEPCRNDQFTLAVHAWFDKILMQRDVPTGPDIEVFMNNEYVYQPSEWPPRPQNRRIKFYLSPEMSETPNVRVLEERPLADDQAGSASFTGNIAGFADEYNNANELGSNALGWQTAPFPRDVILAGTPKTTLWLSQTNPRMHIVATLYDIDEEGNVVGVHTTQGATSQRCGISKATFAINPELRNSVKEQTPVIPGQKMELKMRGMAQAHLLEEGHSLRLVIATSQPDKAPVIPRNSGQVTVHMGGESAGTDDPASKPMLTRVVVPAIKNARLRNDNFYQDLGDIDCTG